MTAPDPPPEKPAELVLKPSGVEATAELGEPRAILERHAPDGIPLGTDVHYQGQRAASSELSEDGRLASSATGAATPGTTNEGWAVDTLRERLSRELGAVSLLPGAKDSAGEDRLLKLSDGRRLVVQVVTARLDPGHWKQAKAQGLAAKVSSPEEVAADLRQAIVKKASKSILADRRNTILALDAQFTPEAAYPGVITAYLAANGSPETEFGYFQVWVVGPTVEACSRLHHAT